LNKFSKDLIKSLGEAVDHAEGRASSARVHVVEVPDVRAIRRKLHTSQQEGEGRAAGIARHNEKDCIRNAHAAPCQLPTFLPSALRIQSFSLSHTKRQGEQFLATGRSTLLD
jgi:hypothetical protein